MPRPTPLDFIAPAVDVARALIGALLRVDGGGGRIVETGACDATEPPRTATAPLRRATLRCAREPTDGLDAMRARRGLDDERLLCSGHGSPRMDASAHGNDGLQARATELRGWPAAAQRWCIFDNTASGAAAADALRLRACL